jgi:hypothetical protein
MNAPVVAQPAPSSSKLIAPLWHTALFLLALIGVALWSAHRHGLPSLGGPRATSYLITIACEWLLLGLAVWGIWLGGVSVQSVIGGQWSKASEFLRDLGVGFTFLLGSNVLLIALSAILRPGSDENIRKMLPQSTVEMLLWVLVSLTAGICEEFVFRGYLQMQISGLLKNATAGLVLQGIIFGAAHAYQGPKRMLIIAVLGCALGALAKWQKSLRPGMLSHFLQDLAGGLILGRH